MSFFEKDEIRLLWPFYLEILVSTSFLLAPIFFVIYMYNLSFSLTQIGIIISVSSIAKIIGEIPTGAIADLHGRKFSTLLGFGLCAIFLAFLFFVTNFYGMLLIWTLFWISMTFISGAYESWIVDNLKFYKKSKIIHNFYIKNHSFMNAGIFIGGIFGALVVKFLGIEYIWLISSFSCFLSLFLLMIPKEEIKNHFQERKTFKMLWTQTKDSIKYSKNHKVIFLILIAGLILSVSWALKGNLTFQPLLQEKGIPLEFFGYLASLNGLIGIFVPYISKPFVKNKKNFIGYSIIISAFLFFLIPIVNSWIILSIIWILSLSFVNLTIPAIGSFTQKFIPSKKRATITSINSMTYALGSAIVLPFVGILADNLGKEYVIVLGGIITLIGGIIYLKIKE